jgi:hypothetical protein
VFSLTIKVNLARVRFHSCVVHFLELSFTIKGMVACVRFALQCNVIFDNALMDVLQGKLACASFPSLCNVNVFSKTLVLSLMM